MDLPIEWILLFAMGSAFFVLRESATPTTSDENDEGIDQDAAILGNDVTDQISEELAPLDTQEVDSYHGGAGPFTITVQAIGGGFYLRQDAAQSFLRLKAQADLVNQPLQINSAFRFMADQIRLFAQHVAGTLPTPVAPPGHSNHQSGIALDIAVQRSTSSPTYVWLNNFAGPFGWTNVGARFSTPEPWHWEYDASQDTFAV